MDVVCVSYPQPCLDGQVPSPVAFIFISHWSRKMDAGCRPSSRRQSHLDFQFKKLCSRNTRPTNLCKAQYDATQLA